MVFNPPKDGEIHAVVVDEFANEMSGELAGLADNIEALLNDYAENGQTLTPPGTNQYVGADGQTEAGRWHVRGPTP